MLELLSVTRTTVNHRCESWWSKMPGITFSRAFDEDLAKLDLSLCCCHSHFKDADLNFQWLGQFSERFWWRCCQDWYVFVLPPQTDCKELLFPSNGIKLSANLAHKGLAGKDKDIYALLWRICRDRRLRTFSIDL